MRPYADLYRRWISMPGVQAADVAVLSALYAHADRDGLCLATQGELAEELRQSRAWINAILKNLQEPPVALVAARKRRGYRGYLYELTDAADRSCQPADSDRRGADTALGTRTPLNPESSFSSPERVEALPVDWQPTAEDVAWAATERPDVDPANVTEKFVLWCRKAHGRNGYRPADPSAAWRRWIARELIAPPPSAVTALPPDGAGTARSLPPFPSPRWDARHERRFHRPSTDPSGLGQPSVARGPAPRGPARGDAPGLDAPGSGLASRNQDTLAALRARLARPA